MDYSDIGKATQRGFLTNQEFDALERHPNGDIKKLPDVFFLLTDKQINQLSEDDFSRHDNYSEELRCLMAEYI